MIYKSSDSVTIPSKNYQNINICLNSIKNQTKKPGQTIVVFDKKKFRNSKRSYFQIPKFQTVLQRNHGLNMIDKKIKLILQLDDKFFKKAIELINEWNNVSEM